MKKALNKGFTLIELLVVIAIIGILASVILASLNTARAKGADAASKSDLSNARAQSEIYFDNQTPNGYTGVCQSSSVGGINSFAADAATKSGSSLSAAIGTPSSANVTACHDSAGAWAASVPLKSVANSYFCVDSTGASKTTTNVLAGGATVCS